MEGKQLNVEPLELYQIMTEKISADKRISDQLAMEIILDLENNNERKVEIKKEISEYKRQQSKRKFYYKAIFVFLTLILLIMAFFYFSK